MKETLVCKRRRKKISISLPIFSGYDTYTYVLEYHILTGQGRAGKTGGLKLTFSHKKCCCYCVVHSAWSCHSLPTPRDYLGYFAQKYWETIDEIEGNRVHTQGLKWPFLRTLYSLYKHMPQRIFLKICALKTWICNLYSFNPIFKTSNIHKS